MKTHTVFAAVFAATLVAACETTEPVVRIETREVLVPVARTCVPEALPVEPQYAVTREMIANAPSADVRNILLARFALERVARLAEVEPVIAACR